METFGTKFCSELYLPMLVSHGLRAWIPPVLNVPTHYAINQNRTATFCLNAIMLHPHGHSTDKYGANLEFILHGIASYIQNCSTSYHAMPHTKSASGDYGSVWLAHYSTHFGMPDSQHDMTTNHRPIHPTPSQGSWTCGAPLFDHGYAKHLVKTDQVSWPPFNC